MSTIAFPVHRPANWKPSKMASRVAAHRKRQGVSAHETREKAKVRKRDGRCRFPRCVCRRLRLKPHAAHLSHKGSGGNPTGSRSIAALMISLCAARHRESFMSLDSGTVRIKPIPVPFFDELRIWPAGSEPSKGTGGPCRWFVDVHALADGPTGTRPARWVLVGVERSRGEFEPFTYAQIVILDRIAELAA